MPILTRYSKSSVTTLELVTLAAIAGLLYCSWPLGYYLNPGSASSLASNLGGVDQPYNWLFIVLDVVGGALIMAVGTALYYGPQAKRSWLLKISALSYGLFGLFTAMDAVVPVDCAADKHQCGQLLQHPLVIGHGLLSLASIGFLTISLTGVWWLLIRLRQSNIWISYTLHLFVLTWFFFGCVTAMLLISNASSVLSQHVFIIACSVWTALFPFMVRHPGVLRHLHGPITTRKSRSRLAPMARTRLRV